MKHTLDESGSKPRPPQTPAPNAALPQAHSRLTLFEGAILSAVLLLTLSGFAQVNNPAPQPTPLPRAEGEQVARKLIANLLAQKPAQSTTNAALVRIRGTDRKWHQVPARFELQVTPTNYWSRYGAPIPETSRWSVLSISHADDRPNQYLLSETGGASGTNTPPQVLTGAQLTMPFAGSDFWVQDLGLDFLHWPQQRVLKKEMRKTQFCDVLESVNPHPKAGGYSRIVSWIGANHPDELILVHADGYDTQDKLLKEFDPKNLEKVNGAYQLESMEMRNVQTGSRTVIEFNLDHP